MIDFKDLLQRVLDNSATPGEYAEYLIMVHSGVYDEALGEAIIAIAIASRKNPRTEKVTTDRIFREMIARHPQVGGRL